jgi:hypothetical protein
MGNILNLVFDAWSDEGKPLPNLFHLNQKLEGEYMIMPTTLLNLTPKEITLKMCKPSEVNSEEFFYYFINHNCTYENLYDGENWEILKEVEDLIRFKNLRVVFFNEHESFTNIEDHYIKLVQTIRSKNLKESLFYLVNNCSQIYEAKNKFLSNVNVFKTNYLLELVSKYINIKSNYDDIKFEKKFMFLCHNRRPKPHRIALLTLLDMEGLLDNPETIDWSFTYGINNDYNMGSENFGYDDILDSDDFTNSCRKIIKSRKLSFYEQEVTWFDDHKNYSANDHISSLSHQESYVNVITESHFGVDNIHISEKSFKPFYYFQLPIFVASYKHVDYFRKEHNLYLFDDLIDHSYDLEKNTMKRLHMIVKEIKRLSEMREEVANYYQENINKLIHNHNYIRDYKNERQVDNFFLSLCKRKGVI